MSFGSSSTAFGAKPTGTQQGGGLFASTQQQPLFNGGPANTGSSLFGGGQQQQPQQGSLFGSTQTQPQQGSLFASTQTQPQQSTFGSSAQQPTQTGSSLFGSQPQQSTSLFGTQQNQPSGTGSLFGGTQQPAQQGSSLFASAATQPQQQQSSLFGGQSSSAWGAKPTTTGFGTGPFSTQGQQQQLTNTASVLQQAGGTPPFTKSTKFNDLPDQFKKVFEDIDGYIQGRIQIGKELKQRKLAEQATKGQELLLEVHKDLGSAMMILRSDYLLTKDLKAKVEQSVQDTIVAFRIVDGFRNPQQDGAYLKNHASFPLEFFTRMTIQMRDRLRWYKNTIELIERKLAAASAQMECTPQAISTSLEAQYDAFVSLAGKTAAVDAELQKIKALYRQLWRAKTGSMRDPFNELDRGSGGDFGLEGLSV